MVPGAYIGINEGTIIGLVVSTRAESKYLQLSLFCTCNSSVMEFLVDLAHMHGASQTTRDSTKCHVGNLIDKIRPKLVKILQIFFDQNL